MTTTNITLTKTQLDKIGSLTSKSQIIVYLTKQGFTRGDIVRLSREQVPALQYQDGREIRYQHVRNVLVQVKPK